MLEDCLSPDPPKPQATHQSPEPTKCQSPESDGPGPNQRGRRGARDLFEETFGVQRVAGVGVEVLGFRLLGLRSSGVRCWKS